MLLFCHCCCYCCRCRLDESNGSVSLLYEMVGGRTVIEHGPGLIPSTVVSFPQPMGTIQLTEYFEDLSITHKSDEAGNWSPHPICRGV